jgi:hypothetical protein
MSLLPAGFQFSQRSLQDYVECQRRFLLRYIEQISWPAIESEPLREHESHLQAGSDFHRLVQRYLIGIPKERLSASLASSIGGNDNLQRWWENFLQELDILPVEDQFVETTLSAPLQNFRLLATYDLIRWDIGAGGLEVRIYDWKTSLKKPSRQWLEGRLQTRVYPYLVTQAGQSLFGQQHLEPERIKIIYWFAEQPREPEIFAYNGENFQADNKYLLSLVNEIDGLAAEEFHLTGDQAKCKYCTYRSLCDRGISAGEVEPGDEFDGSPGSDYFDLDFEQIAEIEF